MYGIDISRYQKGLNLAAVKPEFVIIKATESTNWTDPECDAFYQQAKTLGIQRGVYHFARNGTNKGAAGAIREADYFLSQVQGYVKDGILVLDWEDPNGNKAEVSWAKAWLDRVYEKTRIRPLIYMSSSVANAADWSSVAKDYGLWVANYGINNGKQNTKPSVKWWSFYAMWQYTSVNGRYPQWAGNLDCNEFFGDVNAWNKYAGKSDGVTSEPNSQDNNQSSSNDGKDDMNELLAYLGVSNESEAKAKLKEHLGEQDDKCDWGNDTGDRGGYLGSARRELTKTKADLTFCQIDLASCKQSGTTGAVTGNSKITPTLTAGGKTLELKRVRIDTATTNQVAEYE